MNASNDHLMAVWTTWILFVTLVIWVAAGGSGGPGGTVILPIDPVKYIIYTLPLSLAAAYSLSFGTQQSRIDSRALVALGLYWGISITSVLTNSSTQFYAFRDILIIFGYLLLFVFWFRAPPSIVNFALATLIVCLGLEAAARMRPGVTLIDAGGLYAMLGLTVPTGRTILGPNGILESTLAFPLGAIVLYYVYSRRWRFAFIAAMLQLVAFKRITFAGIAIALAFDVVLGRRVSPRRAAASGLLLVVGLSIVAIFSFDIFQELSDLLQIEDSSANGISLGRYDIAIMLWSRLNDAPVLNWLFGFGPGAADALSQGAAGLNPHNDWLKILFEYGMLGMAAVHAIFFLIFVRHRVGLMLYIYTAVLMVTDNVFIYMFYYPFIAMLMCAERGKGCRHQ